MKRAISVRLFRTLALLLCAVMMLALLSGCAVTGRELAAAALGPAAISVSVGSAPIAPSQPVTMPSPLLNTAQQIQLLERYRSQWAFGSGEATSWSYAYTDLNRNGRLEVLAVATQGTSSFTSIKCFEVSPTFGGVTECYCPSQAEGWPEITVAALPCFSDSRTGACYYVCEDLTKLSAAEYSYAFIFNCIKVFPILRDGRMGSVAARHFASLCQGTIFHIYIVNLNSLTGSMGVRPHIRNIFFVHTGAS